MRTISILALLLPFITLAGQKDPAARTYLDKLARELDPGHALSIDFEYTREDLQAGSQVEGDATLVLLGEMYKLDLGDALIYFDGEKQYSLNTEIEEVYISSPKQEDREFMFSDPIKLLRTYNEAFKYRLMGEMSFQQEKALEVQLYPEELGGPYALIKLYFSINNSSLKAIVIRQKDGILYTMIVKKMQEVDDPGADFFRFSSTEYPNVDVIELMD